MQDIEGATEIISVSIPVDESEARIERLFVKEHSQEVIRFSWWKDGELVPHPLDLREEDLLRLMEEAIDNHVFSNNLRWKLLHLLE